MSLPIPQSPRPNASSAAEDIRDIHGLVEIPSPWNLLPWAGLGILVAILLAVAARWLRRAKPSAEPPSPDEVAFAALERARHWMTPSQAERFGTAVSQAIRQYVEDQFGVNAPRRTTEEFLHGLTRNPEPQLSQHVSALKTLLQRMDLVKFARSPLDQAQMENLLDTASDFVKTTSPEPEESPS